MLLALVLITFNDTVLVFRPASEAFQEAYEGMEAALEDVFQLEQVLVAREKTTDAEVTEKIRTTNPQLIVLMGLNAISLYAKYQGDQPEGTIFPPGLIFMSLKAEKRSKKLKNMAVITYEVPAVISLNQMREVLEISIKKVGVLYSPELEDYFQVQKILCVNEGIELIGLPVSSSLRKNLKPKDIKEGLRVLVQDLEVDAVWVFNDTNLLGMKDGKADPQIMRNGWMRSLEKNKIPVLVSVRTLMKLGHLGIFPDHYRMGEQAAFMIHRASENDWKWGRHVVNYPISTVLELNRTLVKARQ